MVKFSLMILASLEASAILLHLSACHTGRTSKAPAWRHSKTLQPNSRAGQEGLGGASRSRREAEVHHVAVGDDIVLAFEPELAGLARARFAAKGRVVVVSDGLGPDEAALEIAMDDAGGLRRLGALLDRPGARLLRPDGEEGDEVQERIASADDAIEARLGEADRLEIVFLLGQRQNCDLALDLGRNDHRDGAFLRRHLADLVGERVALV